MLIVERASEKVRTLNIDGRIEDVEDKESLDDLKIDKGGSFIAEIASANIHQSKRGNPQVSITFVVVEGDLIGHQLRDRHELGKQGRKTLALSVQMLTNRLAELGVNVAPGDDLQEHLSKLVDREERYEVQWENNNYGGNVKSVRRLPK